MRNSMLSQILEQGARARCELIVMLKLLIRVFIFFLRRDGNESFNLIGEQLQNTRPLHLHVSVCFEERGI